MYYNFIDWCQTFPHWIGFPIFMMVMLACIVPVFALIILITVYKPWLLLLLPMIWLGFVIHWFATKGVGYDS